MHPSLSREGRRPRFLHGKVVINNCDMVVVKHFVPSLRRVVKLRVAWLAAWFCILPGLSSSGMFPIVARTKDAKDSEDSGVLGTYLALVVAIC